MSGASSGGRPTAVDLFCGAGGFSLGLTRAGFEVVSAVDSWEKAIRTYRSNFDHPFLHADVTTLGAEDIVPANRQIDLVVGGPPCQGFSIQRIGDDHDPRNHLVLEFLRLVAEIQPRYFIMENVPGILGRRGAELVTRFEDEVGRAGYTGDWVRVDAADYGVPQVRRRVFFCGARRGQPLFGFPRPTDDASARLTVADAIGDLPPPPVDHQPSPTDPLHRRTRLSQLNLERLRLIPEGGGFEDLPEHMRVRAHRAGAARIGHRNVYGRLHSDRPSATITARFDSFTRGKFAHPTEDRSITLREGARLQTFPDTFVILGSQEEVAAQIGNAVPPRMAEQIGVALAEHLANPGAHSSLADSSTLELQYQLFASARPESPNGERKGVGR